MRVLSNTSPLCNLAVIDRLPLLWQFYGEIGIPPAVWAELEGFDNDATRERLEDARAAGRLQVCPLSDDGLATLLREELHAGESEAIALAYQQKADLLLIDESDGRAAAHRLRLNVTGVLGVLLRAKKEGLIRLLHPEILRLRTEARFFIAAKLEHALLHSAGEVA